MTPVAPDVSTAVPQIRRDRVVVRRRHSRGKHQRRMDWTTRRSFRKVARATVVCVAVLAIMSLGLYFGLTRQNTAPGQGSLLKLRPPSLTVSA